MKFTYSAGPNPNETESVKLEDEPIFSLFHANSGSLEEVLNNTLESATNMNMNMNNNDSPDESSDEDCIIIGPNVPLPLPSTSEGLIKHQDDPISDSMPYITTVIFFYCFVLDVLSFHFYSLISRLIYCMLLLNL